jgi:hypothetical protein
MLWQPKTTPVQVTRPNYDSRGNRYDSLGNPLPNPADTGASFTVNAVVDVQPAMSRPRLGEGQENRFIQDAAIFIQRGITGPGGSPALQAGDEVSYDGLDFIVAGNPRGDQVHPLTGLDFGWLEFRMQGVG